MHSHHQHHQLQRRLIPDPKPMVERLGVDFFKGIPSQPGVYFLKDAHRRLLYVGKAANLKKRLSQYRVANADRFPRRLLRMLHQVDQIEWELFQEESAAVAREKEVIFHLKPPFNRAGTWRGQPHVISWKHHEQGMVMELHHREASLEGDIGPGGAGIRHMHGALVRLLWVGVHPSQGYTGLPHGWHRGNMPASVVVRGNLSWSLNWLAWNEHLHSFSKEDKLPLLDRLEAELQQLPTPFDRQAARSDLELLR